MENQNVNARFNQQLNLNNDNQNVPADNFEKNKEKFFFFKFLMYNSKIEMHYEFFTNIIYWTSILEIAVWIICFILFCSDVNQYTTIWALILHVPRGVIGFLVLKFIPTSFQVIENLNDTNNDSLDTVQEKLLGNFVELLKENEPKMKPYLITYLVLTLVNLVIDIVLFIYLLVTWGKVGYQSLNLIELTFIAVFLSNLLI